MLLYVRKGCPYCEKVLKAGAELGIAFEERNISDSAIATELINRGGKQQVPYLVDSEKGVEMYESEEIVSYLRTHYGSFVS